MHRPFLFTLAIALAASTGAHAGPLGSLSSPEPVLLMGTVESTGSPTAIWLSGEPGDATLALHAPELVVTAFRREAVVHMDAAGEPILQNEPGEPSPETTTYRDVRTFLVGTDDEAVVRLLPEASCGVDGTWRSPQFLYGDATHSEDFASETLRTDPMPMQEFHDVPHDVLLTEGESVSFQLAGAVRLVMRGVDLRLAHADGATDLDSRVETRQLDVGAARIAVATWTDYVLEAPGGATIALTWEGKAFAFAAQTTITAADGMAFEDVRASDGSTTPSLEVPGPVTSSVQWVGGGGAPRSVWQFHDAADANPSTTVAARETTIAWSVASLAAAMVLVAVASAILHRRWRDARGQQPAPSDTPAQDADPSPLEAMRLFHAGRYQEATARLRDAVAEHTDQHELRYALGVSLLRTGQFKEAFEHLRHAVRRNPLFLQLLVTEPETEPVRRDRRFEAFMREEAVVFRHAEATRQAGYC